MRSLEIKLEQIQEIIQDTDGVFQFYLEGKELFLSVKPPRGNGAPVEIKSVLRALTNYPATKVNFELIRNVVANPNGVPAKIAETQQKTENSGFVVSVSRDRMEAELLVNENSINRDISLDDLMAEIKKKGIVFGLEKGAIQKALESPGTRVVCAKGLPAVNGENARMEYHVDFENIGRPVEAEDGKVDYKDIRMFLVVNKGDLLAEKILPTPGVPGKDVFGRELLPKPGKDIIVPVGKNVETLNNTLIVAAASGQVIRENRRLSVIPLLEVSSDVDLNTGNIEFPGSIIIYGSVQAGFSVKAEGNVDIRGGICGGSVEGKNITVTMGIFGKDRGYVKAKENIVCSFIEQGVVTAGGNILVKDVILHSEVSVGNTVSVAGKRGLIIGGIITAGNEIRAKVVGNTTGVDTSLRIGINREIKLERDLLGKQMVQINSNLEKIELNINYLQQVNSHFLSPENRKRLDELTYAQVNLKHQAQLLSKRLAEIESLFTRNPQGRIKIEDIVYEGVKIALGGYARFIRDKVRHVSFFAEDGDVKIASY